MNIHVISHLGNDEVHSRLLTRNSNNGESPPLLLSHRDRREGIGFCASQK